MRTSAASAASICRRSGAAQAAVRGAKAIDSASVRSSAVRSAGSAATSADRYAASNDPARRAPDQRHRGRRQGRRHQAEIEWPTPAATRTRRRRPRGCRQLRHFGGPVGVIGGRPLREPAPRPLGHRQPALRARRERHVVQRRRHLPGEPRELLLAARLREVLGAHRLRIRLGLSQSTSDSPIVTTCSFGSVATSPSGTEKTTRPPTRANSP